MKTYTPIPDAVAFESEYPEAGRILVQAYAEGRIVRQQGWSRRQTVLWDIKPIQLAGRNDPCPCGSGKKYKKCCQ